MTVVSIHPFLCNERIFIIFIDIRKMNEILPVISLVQQTD